MIKVLTKTFVFKDNKVLLIKRDENSNFGGGLWDIPGGKLEIGETPKESLIREVFEETSLDIEISKLFDINSRMGEKKEKQYITIIFLSNYLKGEVKLNSESSDFKWVDLKDLENYKTIYYVKEAIDQLYNN